MTDWKRMVIGAVGLLLIGWSTGVIDPNALDVPIWWRLVVTGAFLVAVAGWVAAGKINDLLPEDHGTYLVELDDTRLGGGSMYELNDEQWQDLTVVGDLHQWEQTKHPTYECRSYDPDLNRAVGNWRETKPASAILAEQTVEDALAAVAELREVFEPEAAKARHLKRQIRGIARTADRERAEAQQQLVDQHTTPNIGDSRTISEIIEDEIGDEYHPEAMSEDTNEPESVAPHPANEGDEISFDVLDGGGEALATDGGSDE